MVRSMTGFGRGQGLDAGLEFTVELRSVNSRYFEFNCRLPRGYLFLEDKLKNFTAEQVSRGKVEMFVSIDSGANDEITVELNKPYADAYIKALKQLSKDYKIKDKLSASDFVGNGEMFRVVKNKIDEDAVTAAVLSAAKEAIDRFISMRETEGQKLVEDVKNRVDIILEKVEFIEKKSPETVEAYRQKLEAKIKDLLSNSTFDESRVITETAIYADKVAVAEETVRLRSHMSQLCDMLNKGGAVGRKLDFIVQEMNRETNTIGSKAQNIEIAQAVVDIKSEIEKIREQIQNIE
ncbi:MAG: YicC family protein [Ruminococcaceae bacterium]|nr:YicC family protein [Oscillospiraceae bacterium]